MGLEVNCAIYLTEGKMASGFQSPFLMPVVVVTLAYTHNYLLSGFIFKKKALGAWQTSCTVMPQNCLGCFSPTSALMLGASALRDWIASPHRMGDSKETQRF